MPGQLHHSKIALPYRPLYIIESDPDGRLLYPLPFTHNCCVFFLHPSYNSPRHNVLFYHRHYYHHHHHHHWWCQEVNRDTISHSTATDAGRHDDTLTGIRNVTPDWAEWCQRCRDDDGVVGDMILVTYIVAHWWEYWRQRFGPTVGECRVENASEGRGKFASYGKIKNFYRG